MQDLKGKRVLITGGAMGMGREIALQFARQGSRIILTDIQADPLAATAQDIRALGAEVVTDMLDVTDNAAIAAVRERVNANGGPIDVLVNNAGVVFGGLFTDTPLDRHLLTYKVNTIAVVAMTHAFLPDLLSRPDAHLVNIVSASAFISLPNGATYASSKWGALGFSESLRLELALLGYDNIGVSAICPTYVNTGMFHGVKAPRLTHILSPVAVAEKVIYAVKKRRGIVYIPHHVRLMWFMRGAMPNRIFDMMMRLLEVHSSMAKWEGREKGRH